MRTVLRWLGRVGLAVLLALVVFSSVVVVSGWRAFGQMAKGERRARMERSPQWSDGHFENPQPLRNDTVGAFTAAWRTSPDASPLERLKTQQLDPKELEVAPEGGVRLTWFGHSSVLVELDGHRLLTDPVWSDRASPLTWLGPKRWYPAAIPVEKLPKLDAVLISHDHYDHLDMPTVVALKDSGAVFIVPLGIGAHLEYWGIPASRIVELDWWEKHSLGDLEVVATPARHASGRTMVWDMNATLWAGYALVGPKHRVYYSGDTGLFPAMKDIGERYGPFDLTMIETGQYHQTWPDWHIGPEQAVTAHQTVKGRAMLPVHWAALTLAYHGWTEPVERVLAAATKTGATIFTPAPGQSFTLSAASLRPWWPALPWVTGEQNPIVSSQLQP
jgi:L-ascorbate metabolism protein UlaG (beta-lactamase superfamily)